MIWGGIVTVEVYWLEVERLCVLVREREGFVKPSRIGSESEIAVLRVKRGI